MWTDLYKYIKYIKLKPVNLEVASKSFYFNPWTLKDDFWRPENIKVPLRAVINLTFRKIALYASKQTNAEFAFCFQITIVRKV